MTQDLAPGDLLVVTSPGEFLLRHEGLVRLPQGCLLEVKQVIKQINSAVAYCRTGDDIGAEVMFTYSRVKIHESLAIHFVRTISALELLAEQAP